MPVTRTAKRALRRSHRKEIANIVYKENYKKALKSAREAAVSGKTEKFSALIKSAFSAIDKAAKAGIIHKSKAARLKSRLAQPAHKAKP